MLQFANGRMPFPYGNSNGPTLSIRTHTMTTTQAAQQLLFLPLLWFFFVGGIFSLTVGIGLICASGRTFSFFDAMNRWVSFRQAGKPMAIPINSWPFFERNRRWIALVFILASLFSIWNLTTQLHLQNMIAVFSLRFGAPPSFIAWIVGSLWWLLLIGSVTAIGFGIALGYFPKAMDRMEQWSSRWYSSRHVTKEAEAMHTPLDQLTLNHPRAVGAFIVAAALANVVAIGARLF
jgi:hypothetical protein